ncbi:MAG: CoA pyrophosphatase [Clostridiales bacterium]|nr:CoA pyrophosphatase [Clostridiales bacterium]
MTLEEIRARMAPRRAGFQDVTGEYAVLVPLVESPAGLQVLFEVRSATLRRQPGEVCFPGGRMEPGEEPTACALRETWEELGIPPEGVEVLAPLDKVLHQSGFLMHPVLGRIDPAWLARVRPQEAEVAETFLAPLSYFLEEKPLCPSFPLVPQVGEDFPYAQIGFPQGYDWKGARVEVPIYTWEGRAIWGITGRVMKHLAEVLCGRA